MRSLRSVQLYLREARTFARKNQPGCPVWTLARFFPAWQHALRPGATPLVDQQPWMAFPAIAFLKRTLTRDMRVFEYGSGGSTLFFANRAAEVITVEHDADWGRKVLASLPGQGRGKAQLKVVPPEPDGESAGKDPADPSAYMSSAHAYRGLSFRRYVSQIETWPDQSFDLVVVDGRARPSCMRVAAPKVKPGGWLLLDNAEREHYHRAAAELSKPLWQKIDLSGPGPYLEFFWMTWAWRRNDE